MTKTLPQHALELSEKATKGPWHPTTEQVDIGFTQAIYCKLMGIEGPAFSIHCANSKDDVADAQFIAEARTLVPLLAERLQRAIETLKSTFDFEEWPVIADLVEDLERMP